MMAPSHVIVLSPSHPAPHPMSLPLHAVIVEPHEVKAGVVPSHVIVAPKDVTNAVDPHVIVLPHHVALHVVPSHIVSPIDVKSRMNPPAMTSNDDELRELGPRPVGSLY